MADYESLKETYDNWLGQLKDYRNRQVKKNVWLNDKICDFVEKVRKQAWDDLRKGTMDMPSELRDEIWEVQRLANEILMGRLNQLED